MATHINFAVIMPRPGPEYAVAIVRGVEASGNSGAVRFHYIAHVRNIADAVNVANAAQHIHDLDFWAYAKAGT